VTRTTQLLLIGGGVAAVAGALLYRRARAKAASAPSSSAKTSIGFVEPVIVTGKEATAPIRLSVDVPIGKATTTTRTTATTINKRDHRA
jgi:hypothetical protein